MNIADADLWVVDRLAQPVVDWLGRRWGVELPYIATAAAGLTFATHLGWGGAMLMRFWAQPFYGCLLSLMAIAIGWMWSMLFRFIGLRLRLALRIGPNPYRGNTQLRLLNLVLAPIHIATGNYELALAAAVIAGGLYLVSCEKPPPREERLRNIAPAGAR